MGGGARPPTTSFDRDVKPLFRAEDRDHMLNAVGLDLTNYDAVRGAAAEISNRLKGIGGRRMPPPPDPPLTDDQIKLFDTWAGRIPAVEQPVSSTKSSIDNEPETLRFE